MPENKQRGVIITGHGNIVANNRDAIAVGSTGVAIQGNSDVVNVPDTSSISVLFLPAAPTDAARLQASEEFSQITENLSTEQSRQKLNLHKRSLVQPGNLIQEIWDIKPKIVHFSGHGVSTDALYLESPEGKPQLIQPQALSALFHLLSEKVKLVMLDGCYSASQAEAIAENIDYVVGLKRGISDEAAIAFSTGFYRALGAGQTIKNAYSFGIVELMLLGVEEEHALILSKHK